MKDIYGQRKGSLYEYGFNEATDQADFTAKLVSLNSKWESRCTGFFYWFLRKRKQKMISSVICSAREGTDVYWLFYQNDVESQHFVEKVQQSFKKKSVRDVALGFKTIMIIERRTKMKYVSIAWPYQSIKWFVISPSQVVSGG